MALLDGQYLERTFSANRRRIDSTLHVHMALRRRREMGWIGLSNNADGIGDLQRSHHRRRHVTSHDMAGYHSITALVYSITRMGPRVYERFTDMRDELVLDAVTWLAAHHRIAVCTPNGC